MRLARKFIQTTFLFSALIIASIYASSAFAVCYVNGLATGANTGSSWRDAYTNPQFALLNAACKEIWVAKGIYKPTLGTDPTVSFQVKSGVELYGGFVSNETNRDARVPATNLTVLSGDIGNDDLGAPTTGVDTTPGDIQGINSYHVLFLNGGNGSKAITSSTIIDGFTITGGNASSTGLNANGGGLYCYGYGASRDPDTGICSPVLRNIVFSGNTASNDGGALYADASSLGISSPVLVSVTFHGNSAGNAGGALCARTDSGGESSPTLDVVFFNGNSAKLGGAMFHEAGFSSFVVSESNPTLTNVVFGGNSADTGGAMYTHSTGGGLTNPRFNIVTFNENRTNPKDINSSPYGGGFFVLSEGTGSQSHPSFVNVTFNQNTATFGGAVMDRALSAAVNVLTLTNVTVDGNIAEDGGGLYNVSASSLSAVYLSNVILWDDVATVDSASSEIKNIGVTVMASYGVIENACPFSPEFRCSNISKTSPLLQPLSENGGFTRTMVPAYGSSAIDTGNDGLCPSGDQRGFVRPQGSHCEIGAVEVIPLPPPVADPKTIVVLKNSSKEIAFSASDANSDGPFSYTYAVASGPSHGLLTVPTATTIYVPTKDYIGPDSFTYTATDINGTSVPATVLITVIPPPPPVALPFDVTTPRNTPKSVTLGATDDNPGGPFAYTFALVDLPMHGTVALAGGISTYTPAHDYVGNDSFTYTATDINGTSLPATVTIHVLPVPPPVAVPRAIVVPFNTSGTVTFQATDSNSGGPFTFSFATASLPGHGTLGVVEGNKIVYTPAHNYSGPDSFTYTATDVNGTSAPAVVSITVLPIGAPLPPTSTTAVPTLGALGTLALAGLLGILGLHGKREQS